MIAIGTSFVLEQSLAHLLVSQLATNQAFGVVRYDIIAWVLG